MVTNITLSSNEITVHLSCSHSFLLEVLLRGNITSGRIACRCWETGHELVGILYSLGR